MVAAADIVNRALAQIAAQSNVTGAVGNFSGTGNAALAANILYPGVVQMVLREQDWEFARTQAALTATANAPLAPWAFEYVYPSDCVKVRQVAPATWAASDPQPVRWSVGEHIVSGAAQKVIGTNQAAAMLVYTTSNVVENQWDALFQEAVVRALASEFSMALAGRPDFQKVILQQAGAVMQAGGGRDS